MAIVRNILPWLVIALLAAAPAHAAKRKGRRAAVDKPVHHLVMQPQLLPRFPGIVSPLTPQQRAQYDVDHASRPLLQRFENLPLPNGLSVTLDRSLRVRLDLATLWDTAVQPPNTYSLTLEAQSGIGWVWLTYRLPSTQLQPLTPLALHGEERPDE